MKLSEIAKELREIIQFKQQELKLEFEEKDHIYSMMGKKDFPSVSKVIKKFYEEFPAEEVSLKMAKGDPIQQQNLLESWKKAGEYSTNLGSRTHYFLEKILIEKNGNYKDIRKPIYDCDLEQVMKSDAMVSAGHKYLQLMEERGCELLDTEIVLGHPDLGYTGQPDKIWITKNKTGDDYGMLITDWKTNQKKNFETHSYTKSMFAPFEQYPNTALGHYYLQLPLYGKLLSKMLEGTKYENLRLYGCIIVHLNDDGYFSEYRVPKEIIEKVYSIDIKKYLNS